MEKHLTKRSEKSYDSALTNCLASSAASHLIGGVPASMTISSAGEMLHHLTGREQWPRRLGPRDHEMAKPGRKPIPLP
jgi:hypothetical protein